MAKSPTSSQFELPEGLDPVSLSRSLERAGEILRNPETSAVRIFHDTFDWRLYRRGQALEVLDGESPRLLWREVRGARLGHLDAPVARFAWDLPPGPFRQRLAPILEMRALLPVARVETTSERLDLLDGADKTVCRVYLENHRVASPEGSQSRPLPASLRVEGVRGYEKTGGLVVQLLREELGLAPTEDDVLDDALEALGREPGDYSSKIRVDLRPEMPAADATRAILLDLLGTMEANEEGAREDVDSEFLHDFRVAVRRTRSALGQLKSVLPAAPSQRFRPGFRWLGSLTGPTRDLDVYLLKLPRYSEWLPRQLRGDLAPLDTFLRGRQREEQQKLARGLASRRYRKLVADWRAFLSAASPPSKDAPRGTDPIRAVGDERIRKVFRKAIRQGEAIDDATQAESLHEMRKTCKKLRYLLEFFRSLYPGKEVADFVKALKGLQDNLGEFQDLHVHSESLGAFAAEMEAEGMGSAKTFMAMGVLLEKFSERMKEVRGEFAERFGAFADTRNRRRFSVTFGDVSRDRRASP